MTWRPSYVKQFSFVAALALGAALAPGRVHAQVGYPPERSPFYDLEYRQELTPFAGYFLASGDPAKVAPRSGPMLGARYDVRIGGPAQLTVRAARVFSERTPIDPTKAVGQRAFASRSVPLYTGDLSLSINLTGQKSFHRLVPVVTGGIGIASEPGSREDVGGYKFGTSFAFLFGGGLRWVPGGRFQLRADVADYLYQVQYPSSYVLGTDTDPPVLRPSQGRSSWQHNAALTVGASYLFFR
jgi:hypothetical protein